MVGDAFKVPELKQTVDFPQSLPGCYSYLGLSSTPYKEYNNYTLFALLVICCTTQMHQRLFLEFLMSLTPFFLLQLWVQLAAVM